MTEKYEHVETGDVHIGKESHPSFIYQTDSNTRILWSQSYRVPSLTDSEKTPPSGAPVLRLFLALGDVQNGIVTLQGCYHICKLENNHSLGKSSILVMDHGCIPSSSQTNYRGGFTTLKIRNVETGGHRSAADWPLFQPSEWLNPH